MQSFIAKPSLDKKLQTEGWGVVGVQKPVGFSLLE